MGIKPEFYDRDYFEAGIPSNKSDYNGYKWCNQYDTRAKDLIKHFNPKKVLDAGCAKGFLTRAFRSYEVEAYGIDISQYAIENADPLAKPYVILGSILDLPYKDQEFDLVLCYDVLEHLDEEEVLVGIKEACRVSSKIVAIKCPFIVYDWDRDKSHIGIKPKEVWIERFKQNGFDEYDPGVPQQHWTWWDFRTLLFIRKEITNV